MPNIKISDLPNAIVPMDLTGTFFEVQTVEAGIPVSRRVSGDQLTFTSGFEVEGTSLDDPAIGGGVFNGTLDWQNANNERTGVLGFEPAGDEFVIQNLAQDGEISLRVRDGSVHLVTADYGADIPTTGAFKVPVGTTGEEPAPVNGQIRYDSSNNIFRGVVSGVWTDLGPPLGLNDLTDVTLTTPATGGVLYKSAGDWLDTGVILITDGAGAADTEVEILGSGAFDTEFRIRTDGTAGGLGIFHDQGTTNTNLWEVNSAGVIVRQWGAFIGSGGVQLHYANRLGFETTNNGADIIGVPTGVTIASVIALGDIRTEFRVRNTTGAMNLTVDTGGVASIRQASASGGFEEDWITLNRNASVDIGFDGTVRLSTTADGADVFGTIFDVVNVANTGASIHVRDLDSGARFNADGTFFTISQTSGAGGLQDTWIRCAQDGGVEVRFNNQNAMRTVIAASGSLEVNNTVTGGGFERVLTTADLGGAVALNDLTDVTLTTEATGDILYKSAGDWIDTSALVINPAAAVEIKHAGNSSLVTRADGYDMWGSVATDPTVGGNQDTYLRLLNSGGTQIGYLGYINEEQLTIRNYIHDGNVRLEGEDGSGNVRIMFDSDPGSGTSIYHPGTNQVRIGTAADGIQISSDSSNNPAVGGVQDVRIVFANSLGNIVGFMDWEGTIDWTMENSTHGGSIILQAQDSAGAVHEMINMDPDAGIDLSFDGTVTLSILDAQVDFLVALMDMDNSGSAAASSYLIRNSEGGFRITVDGDNTTFNQTASNGGTEALLFTFTNNAQTSFYFNGTLEAETQQHNADHVTSGLTAEDHGGNAIDVGWNLMPVIERDTSLTFAELHVSKMIHRDDTAAAAFTLPSGTTGAVPPVGSIIMLTNENATGAMTILASGTLRWLEGSGTPSTGTRTLAEGGICTVYHYSDTEWWIWGIGLT